MCFLYVDTAVSTLQASFSSWSLIISILQLRNLRPGKAKSLFDAFAKYKWRIQEMNRGSLSPKSDF